MKIILKIYQKTIDSQGTFAHIAEVPGSLRSFLSQRRCTSMLTRRFSSTLGAAMALVAFLASSTAWAADEEYRSANTGNWNDYTAPQTWEVWRNGQWVEVTSAADLPNSGDKVRILDGYTVTVSDSQSITEIVVEGGSSGGRIDINGSSTTAAVLTVGGDSPSVSIGRIDGIRIIDQYSTLAFTESVILGSPGGGTGSLRGMHSSATFEIATGEDGSNTVEVQTIIPITGAMLIKKTGEGTGNFFNGYYVEANIEGHMLELDSSLSAIETYNPLQYNWKVTVSGATLLFDHTSSDGNFLVGPGTLALNSDVSGDLFAFLIGGTVDVDAHNGVCFSFGSYGSSNCTTHSSPFCVDRSCP